MNGRDVRRQHRAGPVDHGLLRRRGFEARRLADDPGGQHAAARAAGDEQIVGIDVAVRDRRIDGAHQVVVVLARIVVMNEIGELFAVRRRAARIGVQHDVTRRGVELIVGREHRTVGGERSAVNFQDQRIFLAAGRSPAASRATHRWALIERRLDRRAACTSPSVLSAQQAVVEMGQLPHASAARDGDVGRTLRASRW